MVQHVTPGVTEISVSPGNLPRSHLFSNPGIPSWTISANKTIPDPRPQRTIYWMFNSRSRRELAIKKQLSWEFKIEPSVAIAFWIKWRKFLNWSKLNPSDPSRTTVSAWSAEHTGSIHTDYLKYRSYLLKSLIVSPLQELKMPQINFE